MSSPLRIAVVAHLRYPIAPPFMGGMEAHCHGLVHALVRRGHDVTLFASGDSDAGLPLKAAMPVHYDAVLPWARWRGTPELTAFQASAFARAWEMISRGGFDVVHNNSMHPELHRWALEGRVPVVTSLHIPPFAQLADAIDRYEASWLRQTTTSLAHQKSWWTTPPRSASVVYNGIDTASWPFRAMGNGRGVWCGRITPTKGTAVAIRAAKAAGLALDIAGPIDCETYFQTEVLPLLDGNTVHHGHLSGSALSAIVGDASVLLATPMWEEPFGLVAVEAMACGVPVAALDRGALREVVGGVGALARTPAGLPDVIVRALQTSRVACRAHVERSFSVAKMIEGYEAAYAAAIEGARVARSSSTRALLA